MITFKEFYILEVTQLNNNQIVNGRLPDQSLMSIDDQYGNRLSPPAARAFLRAKKDAEQSTGEPLELVGPNSSYRTIEQQEAIAKQYGIGQAARPGRSNHGFGLAVDLKKNKAWEWFVTNGPRYGFHQLNSTNEKHHFDFKGDSGFGGKELVYGDGSQAPPTSQRSSNTREEPEEALDSDSSSPGGISSVEDALNQLKTGIEVFSGAMKGI